VQEHESRGNLKIERGIDAVVNGAAGALAKKIERHHSVIPSGFRISGVESVAQDSKCFDTDSALSSLS